MYSFKRPLILLFLLTLFKTYSQTPGATYCGNVKSSPAISLSGINNRTISQVEIKDISGAGIFLNNCHNIIIEKSIIRNTTGVGIKLLNCSNITIRDNRISEMASGVYAVNSKGIKVVQNSFLNANGPYPRGQMVQFDKVNGGENVVSHNAMENILGESYPEDVINMYKSNGTESNPILIENNWIRGGGPSRSGGGIMTGDNGGSNVIVRHNILVDPGQYGIAAASGTNIKILNNKVYGKPQYFTNVGIYAWNQYPYPMNNITISGNEINYRKSSGGPNPLWISGNTGAVHGRGTNNKDARIDASILPKVIFTSCNGSVDAEEEKCTEVTWYADKDKDGLGDKNDTVIACEQPSGYVQKAGDLCPNNPNKTAPNDCGCDTETSSGSKTAVMRINAGGGASTFKGNHFEADKYASEGWTARTGSAIQGTSDPAIYQSERYASKDKGTFYYNIPVENGSYEIVLHFAEIYWRGKGQRVFEVFVEGSQVVSNYDMVAAVGSKTADTKTYSVNVTDGILDLKFASIVNRAKIAAIEVYATTGGSCGSEKCTEVTWYADADGDGLGDLNKTVKACDQPEGYVAKAGDLCPDNANKTEPNACGCDTETSTGSYMLINTGGGKLELPSGTFMADQYSKGGRTASTGAPIAGTTNDALYQSERYSDTNYGSYGYDIPVDNGSYKVTLHFAEIYWNHPGSRVFSVDLEGNRVISDLDLVAKVGRRTAYTKTFTVDITDGKLNLFLKASRNRPTLAGIEIAIADAGSGCSSSAAASSFAALGITDTQVKNSNTLDQVAVYPTLVTTTFNVVAPERADMSIVDASGRQVRSLALNKGENSLNISELPKGIYILNLLLESGKTDIRKILKTR